MYTQQTQRIEVIVRKEGGNGEKNNKETSTDEVVGKNGQQSNTGGLSKSTKRMVFVNTTHSLAVAKQFGRAVVNYQVSGLGLVHGDQAYQQQIERKVEIIQDVTGFAASVAIGAGYGATGGPWGALAGASLAAVSSGISIAMKYITRDRDFSYKVFKENNAIEYKRARANINMTLGRLR